MATVGAGDERRARRANATLARHRHASHDEIRVGCGVPTHVNRTRSPQPRVPSRSTEPSIADEPPRLREPEPDAAVRAARVRSEPHT